MPQLFLDCDGVLADFDRHATELLGGPPRAFEARHSRKTFWSRIAGHEDFFFKLPSMADARELWDAVAHGDLLFSITAGLRPANGSHCDVGGADEEDLCRRRDTALWRSSQSCAGWT